jgi:hypothetical protein
LKGHGFTGCGKSRFAELLRQGTTSQAAEKVAFAKVLYQGTTLVVP